MGFRHGHERHPLGKRPSHTRDLTCNRHNSDFNRVKLRKFRTTGKRTPEKSHPLPRQDDLRTGQFTAGQPPPRPPSAGRRPISHPGPPDRRAPTGSCVAPFSDSSATALRTGSSSRANGSPAASSARRTGAGSLPPASETTYPPTRRNVSESDPRSSIAKGISAPARTGPPTATASSVGRQHDGSEGSVAEVGRKQQPGTARRGEDERRPGQHPGFQPLGKPPAVGYPGGGARKPRLPQAEPAAVRRQHGDRRGEQPGCHATPKAPGRTSNASSDRSGSRPAPRTPPRCRTAGSIPAH